ncbi:MAG TPA: T9SS type A sorting domain-containing protein [Candidatus Kapabacteria bacterium]
MLRNKFFRLLRTTRLFSIFTATTVIWLLANDASRAQSVSITLTCDTTISISLPPVLIGDTVQDTLNVMNALGSLDTGWLLQSSSQRILLSQSHFKIALDSTLRLILTLISDTVGPIQCSLSFAVTNDSTCSPRIEATFQGIAPSANGATFSLQNTSDESIAVQSTTDSTTRTFYFRNDSSDTLTLDTIFIAQAPSFSIDSHAQFPLSISAHDSFPLSITFHQDTSGSENGFVIAPIHSTITDEIISLQGLRVANAVVQTQPISSTYISVYPNPSQGMVTIHTEGLAQAHATITDVLGRTVEQSNFSGDLIWNGAHNGTYFVNITATTLDGFQIHEVHRMVVNR